MLMTDNQLSLHLKHLQTTGMLLLSVRSPNSTKTYVYYRNGQEYSYKIAGDTRTHKVAYLSSLRLLIEQTVQEALKAKAHYYFTYP